MLRINLRGNAKSQPRSTSHYHLGRSADLADALAALPEALTGPGVVLAGWSLGGALVLLLLAREADRPGMPKILAGAGVCPPLQPELAHETIDANRVFGRALLALYRREVLAVPARDLDESLRQAATRATSLHNSRPPSPPRVSATRLTRCSPRWSGRAPPCRASACRPCC